MGTSAHKGQLSRRRQSEPKYKSSVKTLASLSMLGWQEKEDCFVMGLESTLCHLYMGHEREERVKDDT